MLANMAKPISSEARLVISTGRRPDVRRSTIGWLTFSSYGTQAARSIAAVRNSRRTGSEPQPHEPPLDMASSRAAKAADSTNAPAKSKRPGVRTLDSGTTSTTARSSSAPAAVDTQKIEAHPRPSYNRPAKGRPRALPIPRVALIKATAEPIFSLGSSSRMILMPTGIRAEAKPWSVRPMMSHTKDPPTAAMTEPATMMARHTTIILRFPYMSALRDTMGVATALASRVAVTSQEASSAVTPRMRGKSGRSGTTSVCMRATTVPLRARTAVMADGDGLRLVFRLVSVLRALERGIYRFQLWGGGATAR